LVCERAIFISPSAIFLECWAALPNGSTSSDPGCKIDTNVFPQWLTFSVYIHESWTLGKPYGIKLRCYWKLLREEIWNLGNLKRTWWEHIGNKEGKQKKTPPTPPHPTTPPKGRNRAHHEYILSLPIGYMKFLFPKLFVTILGLG
jgi:hypothetical protein